MSGFHGRGDIRLHAEEPRGEPKHFGRYPRLLRQKVGPTRAALEFPGSDRRLSGGLFHP